MIDLTHRFIMTSMQKKDFAHKPPWALLQPGCHVENVGTPLVYLAAGYETVASFCIFRTLHLASSRRAVDPTETLNPRNASALQISTGSGRYRDEGQKIQKACMLRFRGQGLFRCRVWNQARMAAFGKGCMNLVLPGSMVKRAASDDLWVSADFLRVCSRLE